MRNSPPTIILVAVIIIVLASICMIHLNGWSLDFTDRDIRIIVTDSMDGEPTEYDISTIEKDSLVMVRLIDDDEKPSLKTGDVIQFDYHGLLNHHRVVSNDPASGKVVTKGDNALVSESVKYEDIRGIVVGKVHFLGMIVSFVKEYFILIICAIAVLLIVLEIYRIIKKERSA